MRNSTVKLVAIIICLALIITSFSFVFFLPSAYGATYGKDYTSDKNMNLSQRNEYLQERIGLLLQYIDFLDRSYKDDVELRDIVDGAFLGATNALNDKYTEYYVTQEDKESFITYVDNNYYGIGVTMAPDSQGVLIEDVRIDSPADKAGVLIGDIITSVQGTSLAGQSTSFAANLLRGENGTKVNFTILRSGKSMNFSVTRAPLSDMSVQHSTFISNPEIGYIRISSFDADTAEEFSNQLDRLKKESSITSLVIDLRNNGGGYIEQAELIAERLLDNCIITQYETQGRVIKTIRAKDGIKETMPIVVLVNENSASASELLSAALQDNGIKLVGTNTFGKGYGQEMVELADGHSTKYSSFYFLSPKGRRITTAGLTPDYLVRNVELSAAELQNLRAAYDGLISFDLKDKPSKGQKSLTVYAAQQRLALLGFDTSLNAIMDDKTVQAVRDFQQSAGLYAYGVVDYSTQNQLDLLVAAYVSGSGNEDKQLEKALELLKH